MRPTQIKRGERENLTVTWGDGHISEMPLAHLRKECPCANCKGEVILGKVYRPVALPVFTPGMNELASLKQVGQYGVQAAWKDGHDTGIYSWEYLRYICPCPECSARRAAIEADGDGV